MRSGTGQLGIGAIGATLAVLLVIAAVAADTDRAADADAASRELPERVDGHRPLRANPQPPTPAPAVPAPFTGYAGAPEFSVVARGDALNYYPCEDCHGMLPPNPQRRELYSPHPATLDHGAGRIWCLDCHAPENRNALHTLAGQEVSFDEAYLVCGQCHYAPQKDWFFGAHGKRVANWQGERELYNCTHCHDPHAPAVRARAPEAPPPIRHGLDPMPVHGAHTPGSGGAGHEPDETP